MQIRTPRQLGAFIRDARKARGMTQAQLAERSRVSRTWLVDLEAGKRTLEIGLVMSLLEVLGITVTLGQANASDRQAAGRAEAYDALEIAPAGALLDRIAPKRGPRS